MTPQEKAEELFDKFLRVEYPWPAKECAFIAVNEQIELLLNLSPYMAFPEQVKH